MNSTPADSSARRKASSVTYRGNRAPRSKSTAVRRLLRLREGVPQRGAFAGERCTKGWIPDLPRHKRGLLFESQPIKSALRGLFPLSLGRASILPRRDAWRVTSSGRLYGEKRVPTNVHELLRSPFVNSPLSLPHRYPCDGRYCLLCPSIMAVRTRKSEGR